MKFVRRPDLAPQTRIEIVKLVWQSQGIYGKMTEIAQQYQISRTFLYQLLWMATWQLETLFSDAKPREPHDPQHFEDLLLLLRLEEAEQKGFCASLSRAPMRARHEEKRGGTVLQEVKPMRTTRNQCHSQMRSRAPSKPCLRATFLLRFRVAETPCIDFVAITAASNREPYLALMPVTATKDDLAVGDTSVDTGGEFKNG